MVLVPVLLLTGDRAVGDDPTDFTSQYWPTGWITPGTLAHQPGNGLPAARRVDQLAHTVGAPQSIGETTRQRMFGFTGETLAFDG